MTHSGPSDTMQPISTVEASVVVCTCDGARPLNRLLEALHSQSWPRDRYETIVVDDGSAKETQTLCRTWSLRGPQLHVVRFDQNENLPAARNAGVAASFSDRSRGRGKMAMRCRTLPS